MESSTEARKVGLFVLTTAAIIAGLIINFSKGASVFSRTYNIVVRAANVGGLKKGAPVMMAGVQIGSVGDIDLAPDGRSVIILCKILPRYKINRGARCELEQSGFLGDQFVSFVAPTNGVAHLENNAEIKAEDPFNLQEAARSAVGLMQKLDSVAVKIDSAVERVDRILLHQDSLTNLTNTFLNFRRVSDRAVSTLGQLESLVATNSPSIGNALSNFNTFSVRLNDVTAQLGGIGTNADRVLLHVDQIVLTNQQAIGATVSNLNASSASLHALLDDLQAGKGMAGALLKDPQLQGRLHEVAGNLATLSSNLTKYGLLYKPKPASYRTKPAGAADKTFFK